MFKIFLKIRNGLQSSLKKTEVKKGSPDGQLWVKNHESEKNTALLV